MNLTKFLALQRVVRFHQTDLKYNVNVNMDIMVIDAIFVLLVTSDDPKSLANHVSHVIAVETLM